jgi:dihydrofolate reductase
MSPLALVVAMTADRVIGKDGGMPWHIPEDLKHFRRMTMGHSIIMGRKTHQSIGRALPRRRNIVITRNPDAQFEGCDVAHSLDEAIVMARAGGDDEPRIVGGGAIYELALPLATKLIVTEVGMTVDGDTHFPVYDPARWTETERREGEGVVYRTLELK